MKSKLLKIIDASYLNPFKKVVMWLKEFGK
ncbi:hypothetical protein FHS15_005625 [Paenibacillus castaneae]|nr:hypothetical protein [Paenibacillus castaneae]